MIKLNKNKLALRTETIRQLDGANLANVGGGLGDTALCPNTAATVCPTVGIPTNRKDC